MNSPCLEASTHFYLPVRFGYTHIFIRKLGCTVLSSNIGSVRCFLAMAVKRVCALSVTVTPDERVDVRFHAVENSESIARAERKQAGKQARSVDVLGVINLAILKLAGIY